MPEAAETDVQKEVRAVIEPALKEVREGVAKAQEIQRELLSQQERGSAPDQQNVRDLEAKLEEVRGQLATVQEQQRLALAQIAQPASDRAPKSPFARAFVRDEEKVLEAIRQFGGMQNAMQQRAIDTDVIASAGKLNADQDNQFLDWLIEKQIALSRISIRRMASPTANLDELVTANRQLIAATEGTASSAADAFTTARRTLSSVETIWAEDVTLSFVEDNIERGGINDHIARNLALAFGNDHNDLFWNGDEDDSGAFIGINDGIIDIAKADAGVNDYAAGSDTSVQDILAGALQTMPYDFAARGDLTLGYFVPYKTGLIYANELTTRGTAFADQVLVNGLPRLMYFGLPVLPEPHLNISTADEAVLTPLQNLVWGIQRGITLESEWRPRKRAWEFTVTARTDQNYAKSAAVVLIDGIDSTLR